MWTDWSLSKQPPLSSLPQSIALGLAELVPDVEFRRNPIWITRSAQAETLFRGSREREGEEKVRDVREQKTEAAVVFGGKMTL